MSPIEIPPPVVDPQRGVFERGLRFFFGSNYRTGVLGVLALLSGAIPLIPDIQPKWAQFSLAIVTGLGLMFSKDSQVTGGTKPNEP